MVLVPAHDQLLCVCVWVGGAIAMTECGNIEPGKAWTSQANAMVMVS